MVGELVDPIVLETNLDIKAALLDFSELFATQNLGDIMDLP